MNDDNTVLDTSTLINFLRIRRLDLLEKHPMSFHITDHVYKEITSDYPEQKDYLETALNQNIFSKITVNNLEELKIFEELAKSRQLGTGECAAIAVARNRGYCLAIDDKQAIKKAASLIESNHILRTQDLILLFINANLLTIEEADGFIDILAMQHRFKLSISSFTELTSHPTESTLSN